MFEVSLHIIRTTVRDGFSKSRYCIKTRALHTRSSHGEHLCLRSCGQILMFTIWC